MDIRRIEENDLYNKAKSWLNQNGTLEIKSKIEGDINLYKIIYTRENETIIREGSDSISLIISLYREQN